MGPLETEESYAGEPEWSRLARRIERLCAARGFDLVHAFAVDGLDDLLSEGAAAPRQGRRGALGLLVGNTRALWPRFLDAFGADPALFDEPHPIDRYAERSIAEVLSAARIDAAVRWAHRPPFVPMQRLA